MGEQTVPWHRITIYGTESGFANLIPLLFFLILCLQVDNVKLLERFSARNTAIGTLYLTTTHLIFVDNAGKKEIWVRY